MCSEIFDNILRIYLFVFLLYMGNNKSKFPTHVMDAEILAFVGTDKT